MHSATHDIILKELECIQNRCIVGDETALVFDILKTTDDLTGLLEFMNIKVQKRQDTENKTTISMFDQLLNAGTKLE